MKHTTAAIFATTFQGGAVLAANLDDAPIQAPVIEPAMVASVGEWTGFYGGLQLGYAVIDGIAGGAATTFTLRGSYKF